MAFHHFQLPCASCAHHSQQSESRPLGMLQHVAALLSMDLVAEMVGILALKTQWEDEPENVHYMKLISGPGAENSH